jgi:hypothetical protein
MKIGYIGNFKPPFSTENDRRWSFQVLGHDVVAFQEDQMDADTLLEYAHSLDMLVYSHTHGWEIPDLEKVFEYYKTIKVPTVSVHLDRWAWLERQTDVGKEATWKTEFQFMADASPEANELYEKVGLNNWFYLKPGVVARDCYLAAPDPVNYPYEILFIGSSVYHPEYPFRKELVEWLHKTYGKRFGHYGLGGLGNLRGHQLNVALASAKIVVGDSCFGGRPYYVSDRYYETRGRGGFLLHPEVVGVDHEGVGFYEAGNLNSLKERIEMALSTNEVETMRKIGFDWVKKNETYTNRAQEILEKVFEK